MTADESLAEGRTDAVLADARSAEGDQRGLVLEATGLQRTSDQVADHLRAEREHEVTLGDARLAVAGRLGRGPGEELYDAACGEVHARVLRNDREEGDTGYDLERAAHPYTRCSFRRGVRVQKGISHDDAGDGLAVLGPSQYSLRSLLGGGFGADAQVLEGRDEAGVQGAYRRGADEVQQRLRVGHDDVGGLNLRTRGDGQQIRVPGACPDEHDSCLTTRCGVRCRQLQHGLLRQ